jgi:hypothetical protein
MASSHLLRLGTIKGKNGVLEALKHNKRTLQKERGANPNINPKKSSSNYSLVSDDTPESIALHAKMQMLKAGIETPRKNGVMAIEVLFSLPIDRHNQDTRSFFTDCHKWVLKTFAGELLSFDVHLDESAPHAHAVILPLIEGKMQGNSLIGNTGNLMRLIKEFHFEVARHYDLTRGGSKHFSSTEKQIIEKLVLARLKSDPAMSSSVWACVRDSIHKDPLPYAQMLSIELKNSIRKPIKSFVDHKRSKGKGSFVT